MGRRQTQSLNVFSALTLVVIVLGFGGYPLVASIAAIATSPATSMSIGVRAVVVVAAMTIIARAVLRADLTRRVDVLMLAATAFWGLYLVRLFMDTLIANPGLSRDVSYYWLWAVGGCLIPMMGLALSSARREALSQSVPLLWLLLFISGAVAALVGTGQIDDARYGLIQTGRLRLESLNPISLGHLGVSLAIVSLWRLIQSDRRTLLYIVLNATAVLIGAYLVAAASSRGPMLAAVVCGVVLVFALPARARLAGFGFIAMAIPAVAWIGALLQGRSEFLVLKRLSLLDRSAENDGSGRLDLYAQAMQDFSRSPFLGHHLEQIDFGSYPHNIVVESFMALGILGGVLMLILVVGCLVRAVRVCATDAILGVFGLLFIQYFVGGLVSGALYSVLYFWLFVGLMLSGAVREASQATQGRLAGRRRLPLSRPSIPAHLVSRRHV